MNERRLASGERRAALRAAWSRVGVAAALPKGRGPQPRGRSGRSASSCRSPRAAARRSSPARPRSSWRSCSARASTSTTSPAAPATSRWPRSPRADDQHTLILGHIGTLAVNPYIFDKLPYDPIKDFKPISLLAKVPSLYVVHPDVPAKNLKEFVALRQGQAGPAELRLGRQRQRRPPGVRVPEDGDRHLRAARALPRHRAAADRPARAAGSQAASVGAPAILQFIKTGKLRCIATGTSAAHRAAARRADRRRAGLPGLRDDAVVRPAGAAPACAQPAADKLAAAAARRRCSEPTRAGAAEAATRLAIAVRRHATARSPPSSQLRRRKPVIARAKVKPD